MSLSLRIASCLLALAGLLLGLAPALAQDYPNRAITIIVPFTPGATTDTVARLTRDVLERELGAPVVIDNRGGAGGTIGATAVANAKPDGYTLLVTVNAPITMNPHVQKSFPFDAVAAFERISLAGESLLILAVNPLLPVKTVPKLVDYARQNPGKLSYGSAGIGSAHHVGTPRPVVDKLNKAMRVALAQPDAIDKFKLRGLTAASSSPEELRKTVKEEFERWGKILPTISMQAK